jgi:threonine efflux protein
VSDLATLPAIFAVHVAAMVTPGPNFLVVTRTAATHRRRQALATAFGVSTGAMMWSSAAAIGVGSVLLATGPLGRLLQVLGGAYITWLGLRLIVGAAAAGDDSSHTPLAKSYGQMFWLGLLTNLSNPKSLIFFGSIFATMLGPEASVQLRAAAVAVIVIDAMLWHALLAVAFSSLALRRIYGRARTGLDRLAGAFLALIGVGLIAKALPEQSA